MTFHQSDDFIDAVESAAGGRKENLTGKILYN
jgi:hypothetical protein